MGIFIEVGNSLHGNLLNDFVFIKIKLHVLLTIDEMLITILCRQKGALL